MRAITVADLRAAFEAGSDREVNAYWCEESDDFDQWFAKRFAE